MTLLKGLDQSIPFLIAGGIDVDKIKQIETLKLNHLGYDISSSIETDGMKDKNKMLTVIQQVKENYNMYNIQTEADELGFFGEYGGQYVPETLMPAIIELKQAYNKAKQDQSFQDELTYYLKEYVGRKPH